MALPQLPALSESFRNSIFSNQHTSDPNVPPFDRLVFVGESTIQFGIMQWLLQGRYTAVSADGLKRKLYKKMESRPNAWGRLYKLRSYCPISSFSNIPQPSVHSELSPPSSPASTPMEHRSHGNLFCAYVGGVLLEHNGKCAVINQWIKEIFEYELDEGSAESSDEKEFLPSPGRMQSPRPKYISPSSSPTKIPDSPLARNTVPNGNGNGVNNTNPVSLLNEVATKRNKKVSWEEVSTGPSHLSEWTSKLKLSEWSEEYVGTGSNKKIARAAAAELALRVAGWVSNVLSDPESQSQ